MTTERFRTAENRFIRQGDRTEKLIDRAKNASVRGGTTTSSFAIDLRINISSNLQFQNML